LGLIGMVIVEWRWCYFHWFC